MAVRRAGDPVYDLHGAINALLQGGCSQVQILEHEGVLLYEGPRKLPQRVQLGPWTLRAVRAPAYRLRHSNKLPLRIADPDMSPQRYWRRRQ